MRAPTLVILTAVGLTMAACATTPTASPAEPPALVASGAPMPVQGYDWFYNADGREISLSYGMAESDDVPLDLSCRKGAGVVTLLHAASKKNAPRSITVESGGDTQAYPARSEPSPLHDGAFLTASARTGDPVLQRFRRIGWLAILEGDNRIMMASHPGSETRVEQFFSACD